MCRPQLHCPQPGLLQGQAEQQLVGQVTPGCRPAGGGRAQPAQALRVGQVPVRGPVVSHIPARHHPDHREGPGDLMVTPGRVQDPGGRVSEKKFELKCWMESRRTASPLYWPSHQSTTLLLHVVFHLYLVVGCWRTRSWSGKPYFCEIWRTWLNQE